MYCTSPAIINRSNSMHGIRFILSRGEHGSPSVLHSDSTCSKLALAPSLLKASSRRTSIQRVLYQATREKRAAVWWNIHKERKSQKRTVAAQHRSKYYRQAVSLSSSAPSFSHLVATAGYTPLFCWFTRSASTISSPAKCLAGGSYKRW